MVVLELSAIHVRMPAIQLSAELSAHLHCVGMNSHARRGRVAWGGGVRGG